MSTFISRLTTLMLPFRMAISLGRGGIFSIERRQLLTKTFLVLWRIARKIRHAEKITFYFHGHPVSIYMEDAVDFALVREVFIDEEYQHEQKDNVRVIVDAGANLGIASLYFHILYPEATIYALEPNTTLHARFKENTAGIHQIRLYPYLLGSSDGEETLHVHPTSSLGSSTTQRKGSEARLVSSRRLSTFLKEVGVQRADIVKFDVEGAEAHIFSAAEDRESARFCIGEAHYDLMGLEKQMFFELFAPAHVLEIRRTGAKRAIVSISQP